MGSPPVTVPSFRTGHHSAYSTSSSCQSPTSEQYPRALNLDAPSTGSIDVSAGPRHPLLIPFQPMTPDPNRQYRVMREPQEPSFDQSQLPKMEPQEAQADFGFERNWHSRHGCVPITNARPGVENIPQLASVTTGAHNFPDCRTSEMRFPDLGTTISSAESFADHAGHHAHHGPTAALFSVTGMLSLPLMQGSWPSGPNSSSRTSSMTGPKCGLDPRNSRASPMATNEYSDWQHSPMSAVDLSLGSAECYHYSRVPAGFREPQLTRSTHSLARNFKPSSHPPLGLKYPSQPPLQGPNSVSSQWSPANPLLPNLAFSAADFDGSDTWHSYASIPKNPLPSSNTSMFYAPSYTEEGLESQRSAADHANLPPFLGEFLFTPARTSLLNSAPPKCETYASSPLHPSNTSLAQPAALKKRKRQVGGRQLISCDFCRQRKIRVSDP